MIFIEAPAGVGYSICPDKSECFFTDDNTAADNLVAVRNLFIMKFPELQKNEIYITGESYAGIYIPTLS
jgi:carboxypeptidase C (cathepsin A)